MTFENEYGFNLPETYDEKSHKNYLSKQENERSHQLGKWSRLQGNYQRCKQLKKLVRKSIPKEYRCNVWMSLSGANILKQDNEGLFARLTARHPDNKSYILISNAYGEEQLDLISKDLPRTFPESPLILKDPVLYNHIQDVLLGYCLHKPEMGYFQGLNDIAASLLLATCKPNKGWQPENCFWLLIALVDLIPDYYSSSCMPNLNRDCHILKGLAKKTVPWTMRVMSRWRFPPLWQDSVTRWLVCLFIDTLPFHTLLHVWDTLFYEGYKILFRVAVYQFVLHKKELGNMYDLCFQTIFLRDLFWEPKAWDSYEYMKNVFRKSGNFSRGYIERKRNDVIPTPDDQEMCDRARQVTDWKWINSPPGEEQRSRFIERGLINTGLSGRHTVSKDQYTRFLNFELDVNFEREDYSWHGVPSEQGWNEVKKSGGVVKFV